MNPYYIETILREKRQDMLEEAKRQRLVKAHKAATPSPQARLLAALGAKLIQLGERLTQQNDRQSNPSELTMSHTETI